MARNALKRKKLAPRPATYPYRVAVTRDLYLPVFVRPATYTYRSCCDMKPTRDLYLP
jgi:hypothetical protein